MRRACWKARDGRSSTQVSSRHERGAFGGAADSGAGAGRPHVLARLRRRTERETASGKAVRVVARNEPPIWPCDTCGQPATLVCAQCVYDGQAFYCAEHGPSHDCGEEMLLPVVNSPRMGVCGYAG